jgi:hypothetical protein
MSKRMGMAEINADMARGVFSYYYIKNLGKYTKKNIIGEEKEGKITQ